MRSFRAAAIILAMLGCALAPRYCHGQTYWKARQTGNWITSAYWSNGVPTSTSNAYIDSGWVYISGYYTPVCKSLTVGRSSLYSATVDCGATNFGVYNNLEIGVSGPGSFSLYSGTTSVGQYLYVAKGNTGTFRLSSNGRLEASLDEMIGAGSSGYFRHSGGTNSVSRNLFVGYSGSYGRGQYELSGSGELSAVYEYVGTNYNSQGVFLQTGGRNLITGKLVIARDSYSKGEYSLTGGTLSLFGSNPVLTVGNAGDGDFRLGNSTTTGTIEETHPGSGVSMVVRATSATGASGAFQGWGSVALTGQLQNNGRIIADGQGAERELNLSSFTTVTNNDSLGIVQYDGTTAGWYAQNHGKLVLPKIDVAVGNGAYNWGESADDGTLDLVNSVRMDFSNVNRGGLFAVDLLSLDHSDVPDLGGLPFIGVWDFNPPVGFDFGSVDLTFRYDDVLATSLGLSENELSVYHFANGNWLDVTSGIDTNNHWIYASDISSFSFFGVGQGFRGPSDAVPEPATLTIWSLLTGVGVIVGWRRRKRTA